MKTTLYLGSKICIITVELDVKTNVPPSLLISELFQTIFFRETA